MLNKNFKILIKNFSYTLTSNLISMVISALVILVIPKIIGVEEFGYWQIYLFYSSFVGFLHFGWNDGIYLRYGGEKYENLNKQTFFSQYVMLTLFQLTLLVIMFSISDFLIIDGNRAFILKMIALCMLFLNVRYMFLFILQATNRIKEYAQITMMDRILYFLLIFIILVFGLSDYKLLIIADLIGKFLSLLYALYCCRDIVVRKISTFKFDFAEAKANIVVGSKLMFSNIASQLVIGIVRFGIERTWSVAVFGRISLTLSISNFLMTFVNAIGLVMFPILRRTDKKDLPNIYIMLRDLLMIILLGSLIFYYPIKEVLTVWLPEYASSLLYMSILFPMLVYEGKMSLLVNTYLKTLRKEKIMLNLNILSLTISGVLTFISTIVLKSLNLTVFSIIIVLIVRSILGEFYLGIILNINLYKDIVLEFIITIIFIITAWFIDSWITLVIYGIIYFFYLFIKRKDHLKTREILKTFIKT